MSVNKVILIGNVGKDPEVRYLDNNVAVANFPLATTERGYTTRAGVQVPDRTEWHNIVLWRGLAETAEKYVRKGTQLYIEGVFVLVIMKSTVLLAISPRFMPTICSFWGVVATNRQETV